MSESRTAARRALRAVGMAVGMVVGFVWVVVSWLGCLAATAGFLFVIVYAVAAASNR